MMRVSELLCASEQATTNGGREWLAGGGVRGFLPARPRGFLSWTRFSPRGGFRAGKNVRCPQRSEDTARRAQRAARSDG